MEDQRKADRQRLEATQRKLEELRAERAAREKAESEALAAKDKEAEQLALMVAQMEEESGHNYKGICRRHADRRTARTSPMPPLYCMGRPGRGRRFGASHPTPSNPSLYGSRRVGDEPDALEEGDRVV